MEGTGFSHGSRARRGIRREIRVLACKVQGISTVPEILESLKQLGNVLDLMSVVFLGNDDEDGFLLNYAFEDLEEEIRMIIKKGQETEMVLRMGTEIPLAQLLDEKADG